MKYEVRVYSVGAHDYVTWSRHPTLRAARTACEKLRDERFKHYRTAGCKADVQVFKQRKRTKKIVVLAWEQVK